MLTYWLLGFSEISGSIKVKHRGLYTFFMMFPMACLVAFRSVEVGTDTHTYFNVYEQIASFSSYKQFYANMGRMEMGYTHLSYFLSRLGCSFFVFQIIIAFFTFYSLSMFVKKYTPYIAISCFLISCGFMYSTMNVMRMALAVAILLFSVPYIQKRQYFRFFIVVCIAFLFHKSAVVFCVMYPLATIKYHKSITIFIVITAVIIASLGVTFFQFVTSELDMYENYVEGRYFDENRSLVAVSIGFVEAILMLLMFQWSKFFEAPQYLVENQKANNNIVSFAYISRMAYWIVFAFAILSFTNNIMSRVSSYFNILTIVMIPYAIYWLKNARSKASLFFIVSVIFASERIVIWVLRPWWNSVIPYEWGF